ncbi:FxsA family protein [Hydrogenovibrio kuenenii]|uniref:FxsA family protein n=1 Tax=Hydrogenovibrio kuenenii TaxID=63658 RepID=UPI000467BC3B|nr:FxsA family protein [Hydrogenovibrio kuenenii]
MFKVFFLMFLLVPLVELYVLIEVGSVIGALPTILLTIFTAIVGAGLMKNQGVATLQRAQQSLAMGRAPETEMMEGMFIFLGGLFLLIPGFITDTFGLLFLIPPIRQFLARKFILQRQSNYARQHGRDGNVYETEWTESENGHVKQVHVTYHSSQSDVIEGEVLDSEESPKKNDK